MHMDLRPERIDTVYTCLRPTGLPNFVIYRYWLSLCQTVFLFSGARPRDRRREPRARKSKAEEGPLGPGSHPRTFDGPLAKHCMLYNR